MTRKPESNELRHPMTLIIGVQTPQNTCVDIESYFEEFRNKEVKKKKSSTSEKSELEILLNGEKNEELPKTIHIQPKRILKKRYILSSDDKFIR